MGGLLRGCNSGSTSSSSHVVIDRLGRAGNLLLVVGDGAEMV